MQMEEPAQKNILLPWMWEGWDWIKNVNIDGLHHAKNNLCWFIFEYVL